MKTCLRVLLQRGTRLLRKENNIFQNGRKKKKEGNPLEKLRAEQMIELTLQPPLTKMLPELGQMVLERVIVQGKEILFIRFLDGTEIKVRI